MAIQPASRNDAVAENDPIVSILISVCLFLARSLSSSSFPSLARVKYSNSR